MVNVQFTEDSVYATRNYGFGEEHVISEDDAKALGDSVTVLSDVPVDFPRYDDSVYGDNVAAKMRERQHPADVRPVTVGSDDPNEKTQIVGDEASPENDKDAIAPDNKMMKSTPRKK